MAITRHKIGIVYVRSRPLVGNSPPYTTSRRRPNLLFTRSGFRNEHCQTVTTLQPACLSFRAARRSRFLFVAIFRHQKSELVVGSLALVQLTCPCQRQPFTKMATFARLIAKSGLPGSVLSFLRYFTPSPRKRAATLPSGDVRLLFTRDMISPRLDFVETSIAIYIARSKGRSLMSRNL